MNELLNAIEMEKEWLETTLGDGVECISIENLTAILKNYYITPKDKIYE